MPRAGRIKRPASAPPEMRGALPVDYEIDLHGLRTVEAIDRLERHILISHSAGLPWVHVVHGRGTGALRDAVQAYLRKHRLVSRYYYAPHNTGGDGVTIAELEYGQKRTTRREIDAKGGPVEDGRGRP